MGENASFSIFFCVCAIFVVPLWPKYTILDMKRFVLIVFLLLACTTVSRLFARTDCSGYIPYLSPAHYCDCKEMTAKNRLTELPLDITISDSTWYKTSAKIFLDGFTAYLYSESDIQLDVYWSCNFPVVLLHSAVVPKNQTRDFSSEDIRSKLEAHGITDFDENMALYVCFYPINGAGGRIICYPSNTGPQSSCEDALSLLPKMTFVSSHENDVYLMTSNQVASDSVMYVRWEEDNNYPCHLSITHGACDGDTVMQHDFLESNSRYYLNPDTLASLFATNDSLYLHFAHDASAVGRIRLQAGSIAYKTIATDTTICEGMGLQLADTTLTETTQYTYDTVYHSNYTYRILQYNLTVTPPEMEYDTIIVPADDLYAGFYYAPANEYVYAAGTYVYTILVPDGCTRMITLTVEEEVTSALETPQVNTTAKLILRNGIVYIQRGSQYYTILGETYSEL